MSDVNPVVTVASGEGETVTAPVIPEGTTFDEATGTVFNPTENTSGTATFTATDAENNTTELHVPYEIKMGATSSGGAVVTDPTDPNFVLSGSATYQSDVIAFLNAINALSPVSAFTTPTTMTATQMDDLWTIINIAKRNTTAVFFDNLYAFSPAIKNIVLLPGYFSENVNLMITTVLQALADLKAGAYQMSTNSLLRRRYPNQYLLTYIRRKYEA